MGQLFTESCSIGTPTGENATLAEAERRAYMSGDLLTSSLLTRIQELEEELRGSQNRYDDARLLSDWEDRYGAADEYLQFFQDCASAAGIRDARVDADHDREMVLDAIRIGVLCDMHHGRKRGEE